MLLMTAISSSEVWDTLRPQTAWLVSDILRYWTDRKYGKPSQRVEAQVDVGLDGLTERIMEGRKRLHAAEQSGRLIPERANQ
jgi:hypothetical protein